MTKIIPTFEEFMATVQENAPEKATFNIMGYDVELESAKCKDYDSICKHIADKAPPELLTKMNQMQEEEYVSILGGTLTSIYAKFGV